MEKYNHKIKAFQVTPQNLNRSTQSIPTNLKRNNSTFTAIPKRILNSCPLLQTKIQAQASYSIKPIENPSNTIPIKIHLETIEKKIKKNQSLSVFKSNKIEFSRLDVITPYLCKEISSKSANKREKTCLRSNRIEKILEKLRISKSVQLNSKKLGCKTNKSLKKRFFSEFSAAVEEVDLALIGFVNYSQFCKLLTLLHFISNSVNKSKEETGLVLKAWRFLVGFEETKVKIDDLFFFLLHIIDSTSKLKFQPKISSRYQKNAFWRFPQNTTFRLHKEFFQFYLNRTQPTIKHSKTDSILNSSSESIQDLPEIRIEKVPTIETKPSEFHHFDLVPLLAPKIVHRVNLKELANVQNVFEPVSRCSDINSNETPKSVSFSNSQIGDYSQNTYFEINSGKSEGKTCVMRVHIRRASDRFEIEKRREELSRNSFIGRGCKENLDESSVITEKNLKNRIGVGRDEYGDIKRSVNFQVITERNHKKLTS